ncbi:MAG: hypothetical protein FJZ01_17150 [Candidatus Sericytochromatia bacterium]|nr:hypothetical protein [Candidatus Tanganyikabacteria bacterium]
MRSRFIAIAGLAAGLAAAFLLLPGAANPTAKGKPNPPQSAAQAVRKAASKNPHDALLQAQSHVAGAYRAAIARDQQAAARQLAATIDDLEAARPGVARADGATGKYLETLKTELGKLRSRTARLDDTAAAESLVKDLATTFKRVKDLQARYEAANPGAKAPPKAPGKKNP